MNGTRGTSWKPCHVRPMSAVTYCREYPVRRPMLDTSIESVVGISGENEDGEDSRGTDDVETADAQNSTQPTPSVP